MSANKENLRESASLNAAKKSIKLKHSDRRASIDHHKNQTGFFNDPPETNVSREGEEKLIQLTAQCAQYFQKFTAEKDVHLQIIEKAFNEVTQKVECAFGKIILQAQRKLNEIRQFLVRQHNKLKQQKCSQEQQLNNLLIQIKSVHLSRLDSSASIDITQTLAEYAATLDKFFNVMTEIENNSYEDSVEECMSFINNLVRQELKTIQDKFPPKIDQIVGQFASTEQLFTFQEDGIKTNEESVSLFQQIDQRPNKQNLNELNPLCEIQSIKNKQNVREGRINQYRNIINANNPFKTIKLLSGSKLQQL